MNRMIAAAIAAVLLGSIGCSKAPETTQSPLKVATSIAPIADITASIAGTGAEVFNVVPPGANPHTYEPAPSAVKAIQSADIFIGVHPEFDGWVRRFLRPGARSVFIATDAHVNPHVWLSLKKALGIAHTAAAMLAMADPAREAMYNANLQKFHSEISALDRETAALFHNVKNPRFIQWHPSWDYFAADYGLTVAATLQSGHGDDSSIKSFSDTVRLAKEQHITAVVVDLNIKSRAVDSLVREIGGVEVRLYGTGDPSNPRTARYADMMRFNARALADALKRQVETR